MFRQSGLAILRGLCFCFHEFHLHPTRLAFWAETAECADERLAELPRHGAVQHEVYSIVG